MYGSQNEDSHSVVWVPAEMSMGSGGERNGSDQKVFQLEDEIV